MLFVTEFFPEPQASNQTGGTISNKHLLNALAEKWPVKVLHLGNSHPLNAFKSELYGVKSMPHPDFSNFQRLLIWRNFVRAELIKYLKETEAPKVIFATTSTLSSLSLNLPGIKKVAIVRAYENFGALCKYVPPRTRLQFFKQAVLRQFRDASDLKSADAVITNSYFMQTAVAKRFGISPALIHPIFPSCDVRPIDSIPHPNSVGFVHRGPEKNLAFVLALAAQSPDLEYKIYGAPEGLPSKLPSNVTIYGWADSREKMFASTKIWLVPSLWAEPFGRVSIEAQACNRAVLVIDKGGLPETVRNQKFVMKNFDSQLWVKRIREIIKIPESEIFSNGEYVRKTFSKYAHNTKVIRLVDDIVGV